MPFLIIINYKLERISFVGINTLAKKKSTVLE
jgi:hypothetical protein